MQHHRRRQFGVPQTEQLNTSALELISEITRKVDEQHAATLERNRAVLEDLVSGGDASQALKQKVVATIQDLKQGLLERETEVRPSAHSLACIR